MALCMTPFTVTDRENDRTIGVPCGKCPSCVNRRTSGWSFRLMQQDRVASSSHFITLTYDTRNVPITRNGYMSLNYRDTQLFFKRLRKAHPPGTRIKYYLVGEYGGKTSRPHYHIILYNVDINLIHSTWHNGNIHYGSVTGASIGYTMKYMSKPSRIPMHKNDDRIPEQARMSKGLGLNYLSSQMIRYHKRDMLNRMHLNLLDGRKIAMPRYYKKKLYSKAELNMIGEYQAQIAYERLTDQISKYGQQYYRDKAENDRAAFVRMGINYFKDQIL